MKFTLSWLKTHLETDASLEEISEKLTAIGLEVEEVRDRAAEFMPFTVAEILEVAPHPDADKLQVCKVNAGSEVLQIVCGAPNARAGIKVVLAPVGTVIPANGMKIKASKIRGVESNGMLCSAEELGIGDDCQGIMEIPDDVGVGQPFATVLGLDDPMIEIAITPNRGDCLGVYGIARDLAAAGLGTLKPLDVTNEDFQKAPEQGSFDSPTQVMIEDENLCPYFIGCTIRGVRNHQSPVWLKQRLESIGLKSISALVDITNFLSFDVGRPAHVFDAVKLKGDLKVRSAKDGENFTALDEEEYTLQSGMITIADDSGPVALGGVMGGLKSGVTENTTDVFLEIALFNPEAVAFAGRALQIDSDARYRFERGVPSSTLKHYLTAVQLVTELCGGEASKPVIAGNISIERPQVAFRPVSVQKLVGMEVAEADIVRILESLGFNGAMSGDTWQLGVPSWRPDVRIEEDVVEEIVRMAGYDAIPSVPLPPVGGEKPALELQAVQQMQMRRVLAGRGLREAVSFSFMSSDLAKLVSENGRITKIANPISCELDVLRPSIVPNLVQALVRNVARGYKDIGLFEIGPVFHGANPGEQSLVAATIRGGQAAPRQVHDVPRDVDVFDAKGDALAALAGLVPVENLQVRRDTPSYYHPGRSGALALGKQVLAIFGELHPAFLRQLGADGPMVACEIFIEKAPQPKKKGAVRAALHLSNLPSVTRDYAFVVDEAVPADDLVRVARKAEKALITRARLFDVYEGKGVPEGKKSLAIEVTLQPTERTLTDADIQQVSDAIVQAVAKATGAVLRG